MTTLQKAEAAATQLRSRISRESERGKTSRKVGLLETAEKLTRIVIMHERQRENGQKHDIALLYNIAMEKVGDELFCVILDVLNEANRIL